MSSNYSTSILDILTIVFVILKLTNVIDWSWWYVLLPSIIGWGIGLIITLLFFVKIFK